MLLILNQIKNTTTVDIMEITVTQLGYIVVSKNTEVHASDNK